MRSIPQPGAAGSTFGSRNMGAPSEGLPSPPLSQGPEAEKGGCLGAVNTASGPGWSQRQHSRACPSPLQPSPLRARLQQSLRPQHPLPTQRSVLSPSPRGHFTPRNCRSAEGAPRAETPTRERQGPGGLERRSPGKAGGTKREGAEGKHGSGGRQAQLPLPVPQEGFFLLQEGGAPARAHFSGISLGTVMIPV